MLYLIFAVTFALVIACIMINRQMGGSALIDIGALSIPVSALNGCIQTLSFAGCFALVLIDYKRGFRLAIITLVTSIAGSVMAIVMSKSAASLPGTLNCVINFFSCLMISIQFKKSKLAEITDRITGLKNRYGFEDIIFRRVRSGKKGYVVYIHLGGFLDINTNLGRHYGDSALVEIARRIRVAINGMGSAFKIEGAEFALLIPEGQDCRKITDAVIAYLEEPIIVEKDGIPVKCNLKVCAGVANNVDVVARADTLMRNADVAMNYAIRYEDKKIVEYDENIRREILHQIEMEKLVKEAIENDYFFLMYQPQFVISGKYLRGFETLIRMRLPDGSIVSPGEFIPVAEMSDLIINIDQYVLRKAMLQFKQKCIESDDFFVVSVNISAKDVAMADFADRLFAIIDETGFPAEKLEIEITEYSFADTMGNTVNNINRLRERGIMIALDDFGTGYTSLSQLLNLPVNLLKIDKSLIDNIEDSEVNRDFIKTVIYMGHLMDCEVIAEGVEDDNQLNLLHEMACDFVQGFVWGRPMEYDRAIELCE
ncbi:MAG: bifunctional diguanylate cyclase/phosphodiesterase [Lachnospiraceae bacterium]|nr:bifunctional diguanylate cyclase/phosphodiesterase [Candidatus Merdinaster equi]